MQTYAANAMIVCIALRRIQCVWNAINSKYARQAKDFMCSECISYGLDDEAKGDEEDETDETEVTDDSDETIKSNFLFFSPSIHFHHFFSRQRGIIFQF